MDVNGEAKFCENSKKRIYIFFWGGGVVVGVGGGGGGRRVRSRIGVGEVGVASFGVGG